MKSINLIDVLSKSKINKNTILEISKELSCQLKIDLDGTVDTHDLLKIAYWSAQQKELELEELDHLDLMDAIFNHDRAHPSA